MPVLDYHCHINPQEIAEDRKFENITRRYGWAAIITKWRQMRPMVWEEYYITGNAPDRENSRNGRRRWKAIGNSPVSLEPSGAAALFGYYGVLNGDTAQEVWDLCNAKLPGRTA